MINNNKIATVQYKPISEIIRDLQHSWPRVAWMMEPKNICNEVRELQARSLPWTGVSPDNGKMPSSQTKQQYWFLSTSQSVQKTYILFRKTKRILTHSPGKLRNKRQRHVYGSNTVSRTATGINTGGQFHSTQTRLATPWIAAIFRLA